MSGFFKMKFRRCYVAERDYGTETSAATISSATKSPSSKVDHELLSRLVRTSESFLARGDLSFEDHSPSSDLMHFFINMAICNTVVVNAQPHQVNVCVVFVQFYCVIPYPRVVACTLSS